MPGLPTFRRPAGSRTVSSVKAAGDSDSAHGTPRRLGLLARGLGDPSTPLGLTLGFALAGALLSFWSRLNYDVAWLLVGARRLLAGGSLYGLDFVDVNPPLAVHVLLPAGALAAWSGISAIGLLRVQTLLATALTLGACLGLLGRLYTDGERTKRIWWLAALAFATFVSPAMHLGGEAVAFAQREHWILLLALPYLPLLALRLRGAEVPAGAAVGVGAAMGLAVSMKPHYAAVWLGLEALRLAVRRDLRQVVRAETIAVLVVGASYLLLVVLTAPGYFSVALPLALKTYWAYQQPILALIGPAQIALLALACLAVRLTPAADPTRPLAAVLLTASAGAYVAYLAGGTSWSYHLLPFRVLVLLCLLAPVIARLPSAPPHEAPGALRIARGLAAGGLALGALFAWPGDAGRILRGAGGYGSDGLNAMVQQTIAEHASGATAVVLGTSVPPGFPAVSYADADWTLRHSCLWPLPAILRARSGSPADRARLRPDEIDAVEDYLRNSLVEDFQRRPPTLAFVARPGWLQGVGRSRFDLLAFLLRDPRFEALWSGYQQIGRLGPLLVYERTVSAPSTSGAASR